MARMDVPTSIHILILTKLSLFRRYPVAKLNKLTKVNDSFTVNRYDNGFMVEVGGRDKNDEWTNAKVLCNNEDDLVALIKEYNTMDVE